MSLENYGEDNLWKYSENHNNTLDGAFVLLTFRFNGGIVATAQSQQKSF